MTGHESRQDIVDIDYCVVCGSDRVDTTMRMEGSRNGCTSETLAKCHSCHSQFRCNTLVSTDPATEVRRNEGW